MFKSLVQVLADELGERLAALDAALTVGDEEQLRRTAHACKNSAGIMRFDQLRTAAAEAESADSNCLPEAAGVLRKAMIKARNILEAELESAEEKPSTLPPKFIIAASKLRRVRVLGS